MFAMLKGQYAHLMKKSGGMQTRMFTKEELRMLLSVREPEKLTVCRQLRERTGEREGGEEDHYPTWRERCMGCGSMDTNNLGHLESGYTIRTDSYGERLRELDGSEARFSTSYSNEARFLDRAPEPRRRTAAVMTPAQSRSVLDREMRALGMIPPPPASTPQPPPRPAPTPRPVVNRPSNRFSVHPFIKNQLMRWSRAPTGRFLGTARRESSSESPPRKRTHTEK